jgi:hypothetical protein
MAARNYSSTAVATTLNGAVTDTATTISLNAGTGLPSVPYTLVLDPDTVNEEIVTVTAGSYSSLTVVRGVDGTSGVAHDNLAVVKHMLTARDVQEAQKHIEASAAYSINDPEAHSGTVTKSVHGLASGDGSVVGTDKSQTLTSKTINLTSNTLTGTVSQFNDALSDGNFATIAGTETLTGKTINLADNTLIGTKALFNNALSDADFVTLAGNETLTNKTITNALITGGTINSTVTNSATISGGTLNPSTLQIGGTAVTATATELNYTDGLGDAWSTWTPTLAGGWSASSATYKYRKVGRVVFFNITASFSQSGSGALTISLPANNATISVASAIIDANAGTGLIASNVVTPYYYVSSFGTTVTDSAIVTISGTYEATS